VTRPKSTLLGALASVALGLFATATVSAGDIYENFRSEVRSVTPAVPGLRLEVLGGDEFLELQNSGRSRVVVEGYDDEPYLRFNPNGVVERNRRSPATYLNADRRGLQPVPASAQPRKPPIWEVVSRDAKFRWYDHRIHLTTKSIPRRIRQATRKLRILDWSLPLSVADRPVRAKGTLYWDPTSSSSSGGVSAGVVIAAVAAALLIVAAAVAALRGRAGPRRAAREERPTEEAW
jgi:hypothetical protein